jgi:TPR repeat protein
MLVQEALKVIKRLATQGEAYHEAQFFLANCHGTGSLGLQVDHERAYHLYLQAAKQNHAPASYRVAVCNEIGAGTRKEPARAAAFYRKAASLGDTPAMFKLGMTLLQGSLEQPRSPREAITWLKRAAEQADEDNPHALHELGVLHERPNSNIVPYDPGYAKALFTQAAQLGFTQSQYKLGQCYEYGNLGCPVDPRRSIAWYTKAAQAGDSEAELALSGWYLTGSEGVLKQSDSEAYLWARRAANKGLGKAEYAVGYYAEVGIGIKQDVEFAKKWYMRAAGTRRPQRHSRLLTIGDSAGRQKRDGAADGDEADGEQACAGGTTDAAGGQGRVYHYVIVVFMPSVDPSLLPLLDLPQLNCLNEASGHPLRAILDGRAKNATDNYLLSDADAQLLLNIHVRYPPPALRPRPTPP